MSPLPDILKLSIAASSVVNSPLSLVTEYSKSPTAPRNPFGIGVGRGLTSSCKLLVLSCFGLELENKEPNGSSLSIGIPTVKIAGSMTIFPLC